MFVLGQGALLLIPISSTVSAEMAPVALRGRYMGTWTLVQEAGYALGPLFGGMAMDSSASAAPPSWSSPAASPAPRSTGTVALARRLPRRRRGAAEALALAGEARRPAHPSPERAAHRPP